jgi:flagellar protein FlbD
MLSTKIRPVIPGEVLMVSLTRLNGVPFMLNEDLIEIMEERPDTTIKLTNGNTYIVKEKVADIVKLIIEFRNKTFLRVEE